MKRSHHLPGFNLGLPLKIKSRAAQHLWIAGILLFTLVFLACTTLPKPETRTVTFAHDPQPGNYLAAVTRDLTGEEDDSPIRILKAVPQ